MSTDGVWNYTYDAEGNITLKTNIAANDTWTYGYDQANHLISALHKDASGNNLAQVLVSYDVFGQRMRQDVTTWSGGVPTTITERYAYDRGNVWADVDGSGNVLTRRLYLEGAYGVFARIQGSTVTWYLTDNLGSVRGLVDNTAALIYQGTFDAFGKISNEVQPGNGDRYKYAGYQYEVTTGLYFVQARWYDPSTGRWTSEDPIRFSAGDGNLYRYVDNQPSITSDPSGLDPKVTVTKPGKEVDPKEYGGGKIDIKPFPKGSLIVRTEVGLKAFDKEEAERFKKLPEAEKKKVPPERQNAILNGLTISDAISIRFQADPGTFAHLQEAIQLAWLEIEITKGGKKELYDPKVEIPTALGRGKVQATLDSKKPKWFVDALSELTPSLLAYVPGGSPVVINKVDNNWTFYDAPSPDRAVKSTLEDIKKGKIPGAVSQIEVRIHLDTILLDDKKPIYHITWTSSSIWKTGEKEPSSPKIGGIKGAPIKTLDALQYDAIRNDPRYKKQTTIEVPPPAKK
jgi:RHS repeat-associated protein